MTQLKGTFRFLYDDTEAGMPLCVLPKRRLLDVVENVKEVTRGRIFVSYGSSQARKLKGYLGMGPIGLNSGITNTYFVPFSDEYHAKVARLMDWGDGIERLEVPSIEEYDFSVLTPLNVLEWNPGDSVGDNTDHSGDKGVRGDGVIVPDQQVEKELSVGFCEDYIHPNPPITIDIDSDYLQYPENLRKTIRALFKQYLRKRFHPDRMANKNDDVVWGIYGHIFQILCEIDRACDKTFYAELAPMNNVFLLRLMLMVFVNLTNVHFDGKKEKLVTVYEQIKIFESEFMKLTKDKNILTDEDAYRALRPLLWIYKQKLEGELVA